MSITPAPVVDPVAPPAKKMKICCHFRLIDFYTSDGYATTNEDGVKDDSLSNTFLVQMFGINEKGESASILIYDFQPFFFVRVGRNWGNSQMHQFENMLNEKLPKRKEKWIMDTKLVDAQSLYGFRGTDQDRFVCLTFANMTAFHKVKQLWYTTTKPAEGAADDARSEQTLHPFYFQPSGFPKIRCEIFESNLHPLLRYFHIYDINPSGWVSVPHMCRAVEGSVLTTTCTYEFQCRQHQVRPIRDKETVVPYKICSFDIEASSSHGDFPVPKKTYKRLATQVVDVFEQQPQRDAKLLENSILTAFQHGSIEGIDRVYLKKDLRPSKTEIQSLLHTLMKMPVDEARKSITEEQRELMTLDRLFDRIRKEQQQQDMVEEDAGSEEGGIDEADEEIIEIPLPPVKVGGFSTTQAPYPSNTILDLLNRGEISRDTKIKSLTSLFDASNFPLLEGDKVTFIGSTFWRYGEAEPCLSHCVVWRDCEPVEGVVIESYPSERDMILGWKNMIQRENPDIIIGYNIFGFDYEFLFRRAQETYCEEEFLQLSRRSQHICGKKNWKTKRYDIETTKIQLASGEYDLRYVSTPGRLHIDMYMYFRRDFNMASYKLDDVSSKYISDVITKCVILDNFHVMITDHSQDAAAAYYLLYTQNITGLKKHDYIHLEWAGITSDYYEGGKKIKVLDVLPGDSPKERCLLIDYQPGWVNRPGKTMKWSMSKDDITPHDIFRLTDEGPQGRALVAKYCIQDCNLVHHLINKTDVLTGYIEMSRICSVPMSYLVFRGQGIKSTSLVSKVCRQRNIKMPDLPKSKDEDGYEGAIVLPPKCDMYGDRPVACVDYSSLYPSILISQNCSPDTLIWTKEYDLEGKLLRETGEKSKVDDCYLYDNMEEFGYQYVDIEFETFEYKRKKTTSKAEKVLSGKKVCRWIQYPDPKKGVIPEILQSLLQARADAKAAAKAATDPFLSNILDKRQNGYKVTANSLYGQCGSRTSTFYHKDVAACCTATGRLMITYAKRMIEQIYANERVDTKCHGAVLTKAEYVYGDSVANYTPVYIRYQGVFNIVTIEDLAYNYGEDRWVPMLEEGKQTKECCNLEGVETWSDQGWTPVHRVIRHRLASHKRMVQVATTLGWVDVTDDHSLLYRDGKEVSPKDLVVGQSELLHHPLPRLVQGEGRRVYLESRASHPWVRAASCHLMRQFVGGYDKMKNTHTVRHIKPLPKYKGQYVYDLTTENHHFAAGVGSLIVHNTDSVFFTFNLEDPDTHVPIRGRKALECTIEISNEVAQLCTEYLKPPMKLAYEKTLMNFILLSKKRYVGYLYENNPDKCELKFMGLSLKRRDSCDICKDIYSDVLDILMTTNDVGQARNRLAQWLQDLIQGRVPMEKLMITKALRTGYKNPNQIAHAVLAKRIGERDPGGKPKPGDRMQFLYFLHPEIGTRKLLMGERIETPQFIRENRLKLDYQHYVESQIMNPLLQLLGLCVERLWDHEGKRAHLKKFRAEVAQLAKDYRIGQATGEDLEGYNKQREKLAAKDVKRILFDPFLQTIDNEKTKTQTLASLFYAPSAQKVVRVSDPRKTKKK